MRSLFKMRLTGTRMHKFLLNTCRKSHMVIVLSHLSIFGMLLGEIRNVNGHFGTKKNFIFLSKTYFFVNLKLAIFSDVLCLFACLFVCLFVCSGKLAPNGAARAFRHFYSELNLMSCGKSNIILPIINIFTYICVIYKLICDKLDEFT